MKKLNMSDLGPNYSSTITTQEYPPRVVIDGVRLIDLRLMVDDGGSFAELVRFDDQGCLELLPDFQVRQCSFSQVLPGAIKAFHLHYNQEDVWFVEPSDRLLIGLLDARVDSPTLDLSMRIVLGAGRAQLLYIPRGVAHGCANLWPQSSGVFYFVNQKFNIDDPDERRLPYDILGREFWAMTPG